MVFALVMQVGFRVGDAVSFIVFCVVAQIVMVSAYVMQSACHFVAFRFGPTVCRHVCQLALVDVPWDGGVQFY